MIRAYDECGNELKIKEFNKVEYESKIRADERAKTIEDVMIAFKHYQNIHNPKDAHIFWEQLLSMKGDAKNERL